MFKEIFSNQTVDAVSTSFKSPRSEVIDIRLSGAIGAATLWLILIDEDSYGESEVNLEVSDSTQAFPVRLNNNEDFRFELRDADANTNISVYFAY